ncbi:hypothetical protein C4D60_Mb04t16650 [Musa balbisiana]|uniref:EGF-like calcium-binding domain-containing protein n=1 Tax=Musa balbisiana TaxID=52838 RepID=A0A4S8KCM9_MUSBA|nr:hypothetical protein C4D60_Mb04t16650 [Musa balbisiana]
MASLRRWLALFAVLAAAASTGSVSGRFVVEKNGVRVIRPEHIRGRHDAAIANFGVPHYGGTLLGVVMYPDKNTTACDAFDGTPFKFRSRRPVILLVDRGDCYFALKAWNAQQAGAAAVLVADNTDEPLLTMDNPEESQASDYVDKISIPSAFINREFGETLKKALAKGTDQVVVKLDWRESMPHPDERVEYEFWTNSNDECGPRCDEQMSFVKNFRGHAQLLEKGGFTQFTPHYITWYCPEAFLLSKQCKAQCINRGRYCAPDPEQDFDAGYDGKDVVIENLRQLCVHRVANETGRPWVWWDFVTDYHVRCSMKDKKYSRDCAQDISRQTNAFDQMVVVGKTQSQISQPARGRLCVCPVVNNVQYQGDGYTSCEAVGPGRCAIDNGGCWSETRDGQTFSACSDSVLTGCRCPAGFHGDGYQCEDTDECKEKLACSCPECSCKNTWGGYDCKCKGNQLYIKGEDTCIAKNMSRFGWILTLLVLSCVAGAGIAGYLFYKYRLRSYMDSEIMAIMSQYMPLDNHNNEIQPLRQDSTA